MGALLTAYQARYSNQLRKQVSNPQNSTQGTIDTTREGLAETDVLAHYAMRGITFDSTSAAHVAVGVMGIYARLLFMNGHDGGRTQYDLFREEIDLLRESTARDRIVPYTDSTLNPTADTVNTLPAMDRREFKTFIPNGPDGNPTNTQSGSSQQT